MIYDFTDLDSIFEFNQQYNEFVLKGSQVIFKDNKEEEEKKKKKQTRSVRQNASLHLFFSMISEQLNEIGMEYTYTGLKGSQISLMYTQQLVKLFFWKPIQLALFDSDSTTKLTTSEMNRIIDIMIKFFGDKGVVIEFPHLEDK